MGASMIKKTFCLISLALPISLHCITITFQQNTSKPQPEHVIDTGNSHDIATQERHVLNATNPSFTINLNPDDFISFSVYTSNDGHCRMKSKLKPDLSKRGAYSTTLFVTEK